MQVAGGDESFKDPTRKMKENEVKWDTVSETGSGTQGPASRGVRLFFHHRDTQGLIENREEKVRRRQDEDERQI